MCKQCLYKMFPSLCKFLAKLYSVLSQKWVMSQFSIFWWNFLAHFGTLWSFLLFCTIWIFLAFYAVLLQIRFVVIYALFWEKLFWFKPCSCNKVVLLHLCPQFGNYTSSPTSQHLTFCRSNILTHHHFYTFIFWRTDILIPKHCVTDILPPRHFATEIFWHFWKTRHSATQDI